jgi:hypothetical protein
MHEQLLDQGDEHGHSTAESKRRTSTSNLGVTVQKVQQHLRMRMGDFPASGISMSTIRRLMMPPNKSTHAASYYKKLIDAKPPPLSNNFRNSSGDAHYANADILMTAEYFALHGQLALCLDNMNKIKVGALAVSRFHRISRLFLKGTEPDYEDHDFPTPGYLITCSGVLELIGHAAMDRCPRDEHKDDRWSGQDSLGRPHQIVPTSGQLNTYLRAQLFHPTTAVTHVENVYDVLLRRARSGQYEGVALFLMVDGGPDLKPDSVINIIMWGRLWLASGRLVLVVQARAAGESALEPVEHCWSPCSDSLGSAQFPDRLEGEDRPPVYQTKLSFEERRAKEKIIFDAAVSKIKAIFEGLTWSGHSVLATAVPCTPCSPTGAAAVTAGRLQGPPKTDDYGLLHLFTKAGVKQIRDTKELQAIHQEYLFFVRHLRKCTYSLTFTSCKIEGCRCNKGLAEDWNSGFMQGLLAMGGLPTPVPSTSHQGHYMTLHEVITNPPSTRPDANCPSRIENELGICEQGCSYVFTSKTEQERHKAVVHGPIANGVPQNSVALPSFVCLRCTTNLSSDWAATRHKKESNHTIERHQGPVVKLPRFDSLCTVSNARLRTRAHTHTHTHTFTSHTGLVGSRRVDFQRQSERKVLVVSCRLVSLQLLLP